MSDVYNSTLTWLDSSEQERREVLDLVSALRHIEVQLVAVAVPARLSMLLTLATVSLPMFSLVFPLPCHMWD